MDLCAHPGLVQVMVVASVRVLREDAFDATRQVEDEHHCQWHNMSKQPFIGFGVSSVLSAFYFDLLAHQLHTSSRQYYAESQ